MIIVTNIQPIYNQDSHVTGVKLGLKNDSREAANATIYVYVTNDKKWHDLSKKEGRNQKEVTLAPAEQKDERIPLETSVLLKSKRTWFTVTIDNQ
jgi:hypothetical protein